jgi:beta-galactosidase
MPKRQEGGARLRLYAVAALVCLAAVMTAGRAQAQRTELDLSGSGWRLWLDAEAPWEKDTLYLPPVELDALPRNVPTGGWEVLGPGKGMPVSVPGTVEEYTWDQVGDYQGVSWWWRDFELPQSAQGRRLILRFESARLRAEVFLNGELVGYDVIGNTPFTVDVTGKGKIGEQNRLAVRVTDPGGNFIWYDPDVDQWGENKIPASHGFGGITGRITLLVVDPVYVADVFVKNTPSVTDVEVAATFANTTEAPTTADLEVVIREARAEGKVVARETVPGVALPPGETVVPRAISCPQAKPWDLEHPNLYVCEVGVVASGAKSSDTKRVQFGFRWFAVEGVGADALFRLNGKRIVLRSAISWGFWPTNGIYATEQMAAREVESAKALGLNMVNFHRCIGQTVCFDKADEMGLLRFEEPGGYACHNGDDFSYAWAREKLLRMVKRDRNHPSLIIYNMINEEGNPPEERNRRDMADAHLLDPSRLILYTSGWVKEGDDPVKLHMRPYDETQYIRGWYDVHHALGPGVYRDDFYRGPASYMLCTTNKEEIVFWGEEGAISSPPRLEQIAEHLRETGRNGWDGAAYQEWYEAYEKYLDDKKLRHYFPTVDALTRSMGDIPYYYQGRIIENVRIGNVTDGYVINGWESERLENHSGIVDCFRNPKGDVQILSRYNRPLYVAVKARTKVVQIPATVITDFYLVNELDLKGAHRLRARFTDPRGNTIWQRDWTVNVSGGDVFGELLVEGVSTEIAGSTGYFVIDAALLDEEGHMKAEGRDEIFAVDWTSSQIPTNGALLEPAPVIRNFLEKEKGTTLPAYSTDLGKLDYVLAGDTEPEQWAIIPKDCLLTAGDGEAGLLGEYFSGQDLKTSVATRVDATIDFEWSAQEPIPSLGTEYFSVRWTGKIKAPETGDYTFRTVSDDGVRLWVGGKLVINNWTDHPPQTDCSTRVALEAGKLYDLKL